MRHSAAPSILLRTLCAALLVLSSGGFASAEGERAGGFDYYVLALSWSPNWCAQEGDARNAAQCAPARDTGWILHGLWPQNERGWPSWCDAAVRDPDKRDTGRMADLMGSGGAAWHQWKKHGRCTGLDSRDYFAAARRAVGAITLPPVFAALDRPVRLPASVVEQAFLESNPDLTADMVTVTCKDDRIAEVRVCLTRDLEPRICGADVIRDCGNSRALLDPPR